MKVYVTVKQLGKKKSELLKEQIEVKDEVRTLRDLIQNIIKTNVRNYNAQRVDEQRVKYLTKEEKLEQANVGKVGFGIKYRDEHINLDKTILEAFQSFEDGLYRVFIDDEEIENLDQIIKLKKDSNLTFIKLTMLAGLWW